MDRDWTQERLAETAGVSRNTIATMERGGSVSARTVLAVVRALGLAPDDDTLTDRGPALKDATDGQILTELAGRLAGREDIVGLR